MNPLFYLIVGVIGGGGLVAIILLLTRRGGSVDGTLLRKIELLESAQEREERMLREEFSRGREENANAAKTQREELGKSLEGVRAIVDLRLKQLQEDNSKQIDKMRATVDEKLQGTLEKRLGESFKLVSDRLEQVHQGLGRDAATGERRRWTAKGAHQREDARRLGRSAIGRIARTSADRGPVRAQREDAPDSGDHVDYAIKLPGDENGAPVWLPIDAKFPTEDYQRLIAAQEKGDLPAIDDAMKSLETQLKKSAKDICQKYINPPKTTDFALMFLPTEGLYAEAIRRVGLAEQVQRDCRVVFAGPTTLAALLNSLQMGFRTLAIQKRSSEVWNLLSGVKTEFGKFGEALSAVKEKLDQAARKMEDVDVRSRALTKKLRDVEELPTNPQPLLKDLLGSSDADE